MAPRHHTLPPAQTQAAKQALQAFFCQLCSKGYSRVNDYEAHLSSYDHSHRQRMKDMKAMVKDSSAIERARRAEAKQDGMISLSSDTQSTTTDPPMGGFKKGAFKKSATTTTSHADQKKGATNVDMRSAICNTNTSLDTSRTCLEVSSDDEVYDRYDPLVPTS